MTREKAMELIKKLLATANDKGATENEAMIAALKAQEMMAKYNVEITEVDGDDESDEIVKSGVDTGTGNKWKYNLATVIADNFCCKVYWIGRKAAVFYGYKRHAEVAREVFKFLFNIGNRLATNYYFRVRNAGGNTEGIKNTFLIGFTLGVKSVLEKQCTALMLVTPKEVEEQFNVDIMKTARTISNNLNYRHNEEARNEGYRSGRDAASARYLETA